MLIKTDRYNIRTQVDPLYCEKYSKYLLDNNTSDHEIDNIIPSNSTESYTKKFIMTLSSDEWNKIKPIKRIYNNNTTKKGRPYSVLQLGIWADISQSHFWDVTRLPCSIQFIRAKVSDIGPYYVVMKGTCSNCKSN
ncbi:unnamed protein product [Gordionus sp. m RMFG-2023]